jgi:hypothetical protein
MLPRTLSQLTRFNPVEASVHLLWKAATEAVIEWDARGNATEQSKEARLDYMREHGNLAIITGTDGMWGEVPRGWLEARIPEIEYCQLGAYYFFMKKHENVAFEFRMLFS